MIAVESNVEGRYEILRIDCDQPNPEVVGSVVYEHGAVLKADGIVATVAKKGPMAEIRFRLLIRSFNNGYYFCRRLNDD